MGYGYQSSPWGGAGFGAAFGGNDPMSRMPRGGVVGGPMGGPPMGGPMMAGPVGGANVGGPGGLPQIGRGKGGFGAMFGGIGDWLKRDDNLLGLAQVGTGVYGAYKTGQAQDRQYEAEEREREYRQDEREEEKGRRATADPLRAMLLARLMQGRGGQ